MNVQIKTHTLGKLLIYLKTGEKVQSTSFLNKLFPKSKYLEIIREAQRDGIMNASAFNTHISYSNKEQVQRSHVESSNAGLTVCIELIDKRVKLEQFFLKHHLSLKDKVIIYKEVEFWDSE
jgi:PII-like signaling protein